MSGLGGSPLLNWTLGIAALAIWVGWLVYYLFFYHKRNAKQSNRGAYLREQAKRTAILDERRGELRNCILNAREAREQAESAARQAESAEGDAAIQAARDARAATERAQAAVIASTLLAKYLPEYKGQETPETEANLHAAAAQNAANRAAATLEARGIAIP